MATVDDVRRIARAVVAARVSGHGSVNIDKQTFDLTETGMCLKFVRQCEEAAAGQAPHEWRFDSRYATWADYGLRAAGLETADHESADVVCFNRGKSRSDTPGHIGIYLGMGLVAENTSSGTRGNPRRAGTKITTLEEIGVGRAMFFRTVPVAVVPKLTVTVDGKPVDIGAWQDEGITYSHLRRTVEALGWDVAWDEATNTVDITKGLQT